MRMSERLTGYSQRVSEVQTSTEEKMQVDSEPYQAVRQRSLERNHWKLVTGHTRQNTLPSQNLKTTNRTGAIYKKCNTLEWAGQSTDEVDKGPSGMGEPSGARQPATLITTAPAN